MRFKINEIGDGGLSLSLPVTPAWLKNECPDLEATPGKGPLMLRGRLTRARDDVFFHGTLRGVLELPCARCLERAELALDLPITVTFLPDEPDEDDDDKEDEHVAGFDGDSIDLGPQVREQIILGFPINCFCRPDCAGLCPTCGVNRNQDPCDCAAHAEQPRTPLAKVLGKLKV